jgi:hypothetical protein
MPGEAAGSLVRTCQPGTPCTSRRTPPAPPHPPSEVSAAAPAHHLSKTAPRVHVAPPAAPFRKPHALVRKPHLSHPPFPHKF